MNKAIDIAQEIGARELLARSCLGLELLHRAKGKTEQSRESIFTNIQIFEEIEADVFLKQAQGAVVSLE